MNPLQPDILPRNSPRVSSRYKTETTPAGSQMASISYPTKFEIDGPWFLDISSLQELDTIKRWASAKMREYRTNAITREVEDRKAAMLAEGKSQEHIESQTDYLTELVSNGYSFGTNYEKVRVNLDDGGTVEGESFGEISALPRMQNAVPTSFNVSCQSGPSRFEINLRSWGSGSLSVVVNSADAQLCEEVFGRLESWVSEIKTPKWVRWWNDARMFIGFLLYVWVFLGVVLYFRLSEPEKGSSISRTEAYNLAKQGVTPQTEVKAIQLILAIESGFEPAHIPDVPNHPSRQFYLYFSLGLLILVGAFFPPKGAVGLWAGKKRLKLQLWWIKAATVSFPSFLFTAAGVPYISRLMGW